MLVMLGDCEKKTRALPSFLFFIFLDSKNGELSVRKNPVLNLKRYKSASLSHLKQSNHFFRI